MDVVAKSEAVDAELDRFIDSQAKKRKGEDKANLDAALEREADARRLEAEREENRVLWIAHFRCMAAVSLAAARDYRRRARELTDDRESA